MQNTGLTNRDYGLIGEVAVLSGMLEQQLKETIVHLVLAPWPDGIALVAHLNFSSLCDIALSLLPSTVPDAGSLREEVARCVRECRAIYDDRSKLLHGPFWPYALEPFHNKKATFSFSARGKLQPKGFFFETKEIVRIFNDLVDCYYRLIGLMIELEEEREKLEIRRLPSHNQRTGAKANLQKSSPQRVSSRER